MPAVSDMAPFWFDGQGGIQLVILNSRCNKHDAWESGEVSPLAD
jgi:hypothetical protein